jgi:AMMECR1 domain-containing protein
MRFGYGTDLLEQLRPGLDALIIEDGLHRALFLPAMWRQLSDSHQFLGQLKHRPGSPADHWSQRSKLPASLAVDIK